MPTVTWDFFAQGSPTVRDELRQFLTRRGHHPIAGLEAFLDGPQFSASSDLHDTQGRSIGD